MFSLLKPVTNYLQKLSATVRNYGKKMKKYNCPVVRGPCKPCKDWTKKPVVDIYTTEMEKSCDTCCFEAWRPKKISLPVAREGKGPKRQKAKPEVCRPGMKQAISDCQELKDQATACFKLCQGLKIGKCPPASRPEDEDFGMYDFYNCKLKSDDAIPIPDWDHWN